MRELVEYLTKNLVDEPDAVQIDEKERGRGIVDLRLIVARDDMGRVIGRNGRVANAIRNLVRVAAARQGKKVNLEIR
jgi:predicted RNA-binding protein YlqC (UPF0109 family)